MKILETPTFGRRDLLSIVRPYFAIELPNNISNPWRPLKQNVNEDCPYNRKGDHRVDQAQEQQSDESLCLDRHKQNSLSLEAARGKLNQVSRQQQDYTPFRAERSLCNREE